MTIAVLGASGRTGIMFVKQALEAGHVIRAGIHRHNTLPKHERLTPVTCNSSLRGDVAQLVEGADVIVSLLGHSLKSPKDLQTIAIKNRISVMADTRQRRILTLTGTGVRVPGDTPSLIDKFMNWSIRVIDRARIEDGIAHASALQASQLDWSILRVLKLTNGAVQSFSLNETGPAMVFCSRATVAAALMQLIEDESFKKQSPVITKLEGGN